MDFGAFEAGGEGADATIPFDGNNPGHDAPGANDGPSDTKGSDVPSSDAASDNNTRDAPVDAPPDGVDSGPCGAPGQSCCSGNTCSGGCCDALNLTCYGNGSQCSASGSLCQGGACVACGAATQPCCPGNQ